MSIVPTNLLNFTVAGTFYSNAVRVTDPSQLSGILDSTKAYFIDGIIDFTGTGLNITVPVGGLNLLGFTYDTSQIVCSDDNYTLFVSEDGVGSGNLLGDSLSIRTSGVNSKVHDLTDVDGTHAVEYTAVNFIGCTSLGELTNYRQVLENNTGRFGGTPEFTLSGPMNGYRATVTIVRGIQDMTALFKAGTDLVFNGRFLSDINCDLPAVGALADFSPANFSKDEIFELTSATVTRQGVSNPSDIAVLPNINSSDTQCIFKECVGIRNTTKYLSATLTTQILTPIGAVDTYVPLLGTFSTNTPSHIDMPVNGQFEILSGESVYTVQGEIIVEGFDGDVVSVRVVLSSDDGATFPTVVNSVKRTILNSVGPRDVAFIPLNFTTPITKGERIRLEVANLSRVGDITPEVDSYITIKEG